MKILLTGATGYIGKRLLPFLVESGHQVVCCVRDKNRFTPSQSVRKKIEIVEVDLLDKTSLEQIPKDIDGAYYLVHSMSSSTQYFELEQQSAINFRNVLNATQVQHVIYLSGIVNESSLSTHLLSRQNVEQELQKGNYNFTCLRAGIIIGSGSASFEIIRDLVEKLPIMVTPKWLQTKCQPIGIYDVIRFLSQSLFNQKTYNQSFDIGGTDVLSYKQMLLGFAEERGLFRKIFILPVMTPRLSSYWLYFVTSTTYKLAISLVDSMKVEVVCQDSILNELLNIQPLSYKECLQRTFKKIENNEVVSSWKDAHVSSGMNIAISDFIRVPTFGCFIDRRERKFDSYEDCINKVWSIGGETGWYYTNWLWRIRGFLDKLVGGVGLRRGRTSIDTINAGDALDFWRVLFANKTDGRLLLLAEMKLPGDAWLEFKIENNKLIQTATFRPWGVAGRLYWFLLVPFHNIIFSGMLKRITTSDKTP